MLEELTASALTLDLIDIEQLICNLQNYVNNKEKLCQLESYKSINKVSKTMKDFNVNIDTFDYLTDFDCNFTTNDIRCLVSYSGETGMFCPSITINNCF